MFRVVIGYFFDEDNNTDRIAFIWEVTFGKDKVTGIRVVYDGSNPFMDEAKAIKEYKYENKTNVLVPAKC